MFYCTHVPSPPLSQFVHWFWFYEHLEVSHRRERVLPDGTMELIINLDETPRRLFDRQRPDQFVSFRRAWVSGARAGYILIDAVPGSSMIGVHFKPGGLAPFLEFPAGELGGQVVELDALWGNDADDLRERLLESKGPRAKFSILERFLIGKGAGIPKLHPAIDHALGQFQHDASTINVQRVVHSTGYSHKHFIEMFRSIVGLSPKRYCRVRRFQQAIADIHAKKHIDWAEIASGSGYYDQSHFIHDFRAFSGLRPSDYLMRTEGWINFVPDDVQELALVP